MCDVIGKKYMMLSVQIYVMTKTMLLLKMYYVFSKNKCYQSRYYSPFIKLYKKDRVNSSTEIDAGSG